MATSKTPPSEPSVEAKFAAKRRLLKDPSAYPETSHRIVLGDARLMPEISPESIHLVVTSPPYWTLKEYDGAAGDAQLGHIEDYRTFQRELSRVWNRCFDALVPGGRLCIVVGDVCLPRRRIGRHLVVPVHADISVECRNIGFDYLTPIIWAKIANAVTEVAGNGAAFLGKPYEPNGVIKNDFEYILMFRKPGGYRKPTQKQRILSLIEKNDHGRWFRAVWTDIKGSARSRGHPAPFPVEVAYRLINMFSFVDDVVLDPFVGTGSTVLAALQSHRSSIGYEIEPQYVREIKNHVGQLDLQHRIDFY
jgi:modification methylase